MADIEQSTDLVAEYAGYAMDGLPIVRVQWERYATLEAAQALTALGAYDGNKLIGFAVLLDYEPMHYGVKTTTTESLYVGQAYRASGAGLELIVAIQKHATEVGAAGVMISAPQGRELATVLPMMGYRQAYTVFYRSTGNV